MGMKLPGGIHTSEKPWKLLINKETTRTKIPEDQFKTSSFSRSTLAPGFIGTEHSHFLSDKDNIKHFDPSMFSLSENNLTIVDPQGRMLLEVIYECMQNGGQYNLREKNIGWYVVDTREKKLLTHLSKFYGCLD